MTTPTDGSDRMDQTAAAEPSDTTRQARTARGPKEKKSARSKTRAARVTAELPAVEPQSEPTTSIPSLPLARADAFLRDDDPDDEGATREVAAVAAPDDSAPLGAGADPDATILRPSTRADVAYEDAYDDTEEETPSAPPPPRRFNTLAGAFNRSRTANSGPLTPPNGSTPPPPPPAASAEPEYEDEILDEVEDDGADEWAVADQPTVVWTPEQIAQMQAVKPDFRGDTGDFAAAPSSRADFLRDTGESASWPPREGTAPAEPESDFSHHDWRVGLPPRPRPPFPMQGTSRPVTLGEQQRLAAPDGRVAPEPPSASMAGAQPDPRMERFQELRRQRFELGDETGAQPTPMTDVVKQWWNDLRPNLSRALSYQREVRASGMHPIPAHVATPSTRLGDAFGRLTASAMELTDRAQQAAAPTFKRIHGQVGQAAQYIMHRLEGDTMRQQAPLLGPGRIAVFFRQGVTVGQAQRLLAASAARPMRLIPRKHGFLARVESGKEAEVCERLRQHPYVRDVAYLEFNEYGEPVGGRR